MPSCNIFGFSRCRWWMSMCFSQRASWARVMWQWPAVSVAIRFVYRKLCNFVVMWDCVLSNNCVGSSNATHVIHICGCRWFMTRWRVNKTQSRRLISLTDSMDTVAFSHHPQKCPPSVSNSCSSALTASSAPSWCLRSLPVCIFKHASSTFDYQVPGAARAASRRRAYDCW